MSFAFPSFNDLIRISLFPAFMLMSILMVPIAMAASGGEGTIITDEMRASMMRNPWAIFALTIFALSYVAVLFEEQTHMRKSKPVMLGAGLVWMAIGIMAPSYNIDHETLRRAVFHGLDEYGSLMLFLLAAMTYIAALEERQVFATLRSKMVSMGLNMRQIFWATGIFAFFLSPIADNLTTALVMGAVVMAVGANDPKFILLACINIVNAANAGGAFSPFGDITTLMVWQAGHVAFFDFFPLFLPSVVCFLVPALIMNFFVKPHKPMAVKEKTTMKRGAKTIIFLGLCTIAMAVSFEQVLGLPPFLGMMTGMSILMIFSFFVRKWGKHADDNFDILEQVQNAEWDTLLFFFGVIFAVGGLTFIGYLELVSNTFYDGLGPSITNVIMGFASAIIDNIPVMFAILSMNPDLDQFQWLLVTLTCGVGGSMLSIGSAAGVALMGTARGHYTFFGHLKWTPVIMLGYFSAITMHFLVNGDINQLGGYVNRMMGG